MFRVSEADGRYLLEEVKRASCPRCGERITPPEDAEEGDLIEHCGQRYRLLHAYGAYALEAEG